MMMSIYQEITDQYLEKLDVFSLAITRAHGKTHPETFKVRELFEKIKEKTNNATSSKPDLDAEFMELRQVTDHYKVPSDVCETYEAVYHMLLEIDDAYLA